MKKILVILLAVLMLLPACGPVSDDTTLQGGDEVTNVLDDSDKAEATDPIVTEPLAPVERFDHTIDVAADAYVINKNSGVDTSSNNYGSDVEIHLKSNGTNLTRYGYLKFDISSLAGDNDFTEIDLDLTLNVRQQDAGSPFAVIKVYGTDTEWKEDKITFASQPEHFGLITTKDDITADKVVNSFPITDYVRKALKAGKTEIALYLEEASPVPLHVRFHSKEAGNDAPKLSVYYGTKEDKNVYEGLVSAPELEKSKTGIDTILGFSDIETQKITVLEDTFVEAGASADKNFGTSDVLEHKANNTSGNAGTHRITLLKFDLSEMKDKKIADVQLAFNVFEMEQINTLREILVYGCDPYAWEENEVTYKTIEGQEELITSVFISGKGIKYIDVTEYVKKAYERGEDLIAFYLEGNPASMYRTRIDSSNKVDGVAPCLDVVYGDTTFVTKLKYKGENPWDVAMKAVTTWLDRWDDIVAHGRNDAELIVKDPSEYSLVVDVSTAAKTNGANTVYTPYATRNIDTLKDFKGNSKEMKLYDEYGGLMDESMKQEATGFFYTKKIGDRWWNIDPLGYPFYRTAVVQVAHGASPNQKEITLAKYGSRDNWAVAATERMFELGFNSAGGWSDLEYLSKVDNPISQTTIFNTATRYGSSIGVKVNSGGSLLEEADIIPVFDPDFATFADNQIKGIVSAYANDPEVYGWMSDNELCQNLKSLDHSLMLDPEDSRRHYSYATAWTFMYLKTGKANVSLADVTDELRLEFLAMTYDKYFEVITSVLDKYDPNHLYMGCRFVSNNYKREPIMRVAGYWCDVVTFNYYGAWEGSPELMKNIQNWLGDTPFVVTEWYAKGMDVWEKNPAIINKTGAGWTVRTQADRGKFYQNYALMLMECKGCVGFDWFKYWDNDPTWEGADSSNIDSNKGMYSNEGEEYTDLSDYMYELNKQKYTLIKYFDER